MPPSMVTSFALVELHVSVEGWPCSMAVGEAESVIVGAGAGGRVGAVSVADGVAAGGGVTFFAQPVPTTAIPTNKAVKTASIRWDFLMKKPPSRTNLVLCRMRLPTSSHGFGSVRFHYNT
jgi:hypothetical protein